MYKTGRNTTRLWRTTDIRGFKNTLPTRLYWVHFPIEDLRQALGTGKRILTKEKIDNYWVSHPQHHSLI